MQTRVSFRNWWSYVIVSLIPISYYLVFALIGGGSLGDHVLLGYVISLTSNIGVVALPQAVVLNKLSRFEEMMVASPISPFAYMLGFALARLVFTLPGIGVVLALLLLTSRVRPLQVIPLLGMVVVTWLVASMIGFTLGTYIRRIQSVGSIANLVGYALMLIPPVLYPATLIAEQWRPFALLVPTSSAAYLMRGLLGPDATLPHEVWIAVCVLFLYLAGGMWMVARKSQWRER